MKSRLPLKPLSYIAFTAAFFTVLLILESVFGFHYEPIDHDLAQEVNEEPALVNHITNGDLERAQTDENTSQERAKYSLNTTETQSPKEKEKPTADPKVSTASASDDRTYFENLLANYKANVVANLDKNKARTDIIIRYYHHDPDGNSAYALGKLGFYIHEREVAPEYINYQSNAIFYGDSIKLEDLQLVSYVLLKQGLPIKEIKRSKFHDSWKSQAIEIGTDTTMIDRPSITLKELKALSL